MDRARSDLPAKSGDRNAEHFAVFGYGAPGNFVPFVVEDVHQRFVGEGFVLILLFDALGEDILDLVRGYLFTAVGLHRFGEELLQWNDPELGLYVFAVDHPRDGRNVELRGIGNVFQNHRAQFRLISVDKVFALVVEDCLHGPHQGIVALSDGRDKPLGRIDFVFDELNRLFIRLRFSTALLGHVADHLHISAIDLQIGYIGRIEPQIEDAVLVVQSEVRCDVGLGRTLVVAVQVPRFGREPDNFVDRVAELVLADRQPRDQLFVVLFRKFIEIGGQNLAGEFLSRIQFGQGIQLQQQALFQITGANSHGLELLDGVERFLDLVYGCVDAGAECDVVGNGCQIPAQIAVVVDTSDDVFGYGHLSFGQILES